MNHPERDELDLQLLQLTMSARQHPSKSALRRLALTKLVHLIVRSGRLCRPQIGKFPVSLYEDIYNEARQELLLYICENIDRYDAERGSVMTWVNVLLDRRFFKDAIRKVLTKQGFQKITIADLDSVLVMPEKPPDLTEILKEYIESDPENVFKNEHVEKCPEANFQVLAKRRLAGKSWKEISGEFDIKIPTVSSFYYRCLNKFSSKLKEYCMNGIN